TLHSQHLAHTNNTIIPLHDPTNILLYSILLCFLFFFNDTATTEIYTLSLHDALPISDDRLEAFYDNPNALRDYFRDIGHAKHWEDRKSGSAGMPRPISYAVFCLKKKKKKKNKVYIK